ncbi:uncharacterized protein L969DRAFT_91840 [Mixia osmundae IAM 14324]|uniref:uncharacterized protein n=1 Tax=Mixia osmundae (strain CBS 9802 / IAM 14324 / JCM 22182 / KY 12970) TaxID=764103 RepID=UPI0004A54D2D|nr:uncharacterized protein L969DRAFT_91840 [Mixia osmundae IAM 14324]KEI42393.1 hypothetical protein L969DRAFT_91840 [Mixia osmundae IAM 14324]
MLDRLRGYFYDRRRGFAIASASLGGVYLLAQYGFNKLSEMQDKIMTDRAQRENLRRRFQQNQEDCSFTVLALLPTLGNQILESMDVESLTHTLALKTQREKQRQAESSQNRVPSDSTVLVEQDPPKSAPNGLPQPEPASAEPAGSTSDSVKPEIPLNSLMPTSVFAESAHGLVPPAQTIGLGDSMASLDAEAHRQSAALTEQPTPAPTTTDAKLVDAPEEESEPEPIEDPRSKLELWNAIKLLAFARSISSLYAVCLLALQTHIQLNLLGRYNYVSSVLEQAGSGTLDDSQKSFQGLSTLFSSDSSARKPIGISAMTEQRYLTFSWWLLHRGWPQITERVQSVVDGVVASIPLKRQISFGETDQLLKQIRRAIEYEDDDDTPHTFLSALFPDNESDELEVLRQGGLPETETFIDDELRSLLDETQDFVESPDFVYVRRQCLDLLFSTFLNSLSGSFATTKPSAHKQADAPAGNGAFAHPLQTQHEADGAQITDITDKTARLASLLPVIARQSHMILNSNPNEYAESISDVKELSELSAIVYTSFERSPKHDCRAFEEEPGTFDRTWTPPTSSQSASGNARLIEVTLLVRTTRHRHWPAGLPLSLRHHALSWLIRPTQLLPLPPQHAARIHRVIAQAPTIVYGLQNQRPPVARPGLPWSFTLLPGTFGQSNVSLTSFGCPSWASFDEATATFSGNVPADTSNSTYQRSRVTVTATSMDGSQDQVQDDYELLVASGVDATVQLSISAQLPNASRLGDGSIMTYDGQIRVPPQWSFSLGFQQYTFAVPSQAQIYYTSYIQGQTSLPDWLVFDNTTVTFDGVAPLSGQFPIIIYGSDQFGYGDVVQLFNITISEHDFELSQPLPAINTTRGDTISYTVPLDGLRIDGTVATASNVTVDVGLQGFPYLSYNNATRVISGSLPANASTRADLSIPIDFVSSYGDRINDAIDLHVVPDLFTAMVLPVLAVDPGKNFSDNIESYLTSSEALYSATILPATAASWVNFDTGSRVLSGEAPNPEPKDYQNVTVTFTGRDNSTGVQQSANMTVAYRANLPQATNGSNTGTALQHHHGLSDKAKIAIAVIFGLIALVALVSLLLFCCIRKAKSWDRENSQAGTGFILAKEKGSKGSSRASTPLKSSIRKGRPSEASDNVNLPPPVLYHDAPLPLPPPPAAQRSDSRPRRMDVMNLFGNRNPTQETPVGESPVNLSGLGIFATQTTPTYAQPRAKSHDSWSSSQGSSSLFYSDAERSDSASRDPNRGPRPSSMSSTPRSIPRQRQGFGYRPPLPVNLDRPGSLATSRSTDSPTPSDEQPGAIRLITREPSDELVQAQQHSEYISGAISSKPRLINFSNRGSPRQVRQSAHEDAIENVRQSTRSSVYTPPEDAAVQAPIFYDTPQLLSEPVHHGNQYDGIRLVGGPMPSPSASPQIAQKARPRTLTQEAAIDQYRMTLSSDESFHFAIPIPSHIVPLSSLQSTYTALTDYPERGELDRRPLPEWINVNVDGAQMQFWGVAQGEMTVPIQIVEKRQSAEGDSPRRPYFAADGRSPSTIGASTLVDEYEHIVARCLLHFSHLGREAHDGAGEAPRMSTQQSVVTVRY